MPEKICQSCGMPMTESTDFGTEAGGAPSEKYCQYCYQQGRFTLDVSLEEFIEKQVEIGKSLLGLSEEESRAKANSLTSTLERWR